MKEQNPFGAPTTCQCEQTRCEHGDMECREQATLNIATTYGAFKMCVTCAANLPKEYLKAGHGPIQLVSK